MSAIDWERPAATRGKGTCYATGCEDEGHAFVQAIVRRRKTDGRPGYGQMVASKQHLFCKRHAEERYEHMLSALEPS